LECNVQPYAGNDPFVFAEFHPSDAMRVYPIIERLGLSGVRVWHDLEKNPQKKAGCLEQSSVFLFFVSDVFMERFETSSILSYVVSQSIPILAVYLDKNIPMTAGTRMQLDLKFVTSFSAWDDNLFDALLSAKAIQSCIVPNMKCSRQSMSEWEKRQGMFLAAWRAGTEFSSNEPPVEPETLPEQPKEPPVEPETPLEDSKEPPVKPVTPSEDLKESPEKPETTSEDPKELPEELEDPLEDPQDPWGERTVYIPRKPPVSIVENDDPEEEDTDQTVLRQKLHKAIVWRRETGEMFVVSKMETILGRTSEKRKADIMLDGNPEISRNHAVIYQHKNSFLIRDCGSLAGTFVNDVQLEKDAAVELKHEMCFSLGEEKFVFLSGGTAKALIDDGKAAVLTSEDTGEIRLLTEDNITLGRAFPWKNGLLEELTVSRRHAVITQRDGKYFIQDNGSANGTYVNGEELPAKGDPRELRSGDRIHLHTYKFLYTESNVK